MSILPKNLRQALTASFWQNERRSRAVLFSGLAILPLFLCYLAYNRPFFFTNPTYMGGILFAELLVAVLWFYRKTFFAFLIFSFMIAGTTLPGAGFARAERWGALAVGAFLGFLIWLRERTLPFSGFHAVAFFCVLTSLLSVTVSLSPTIALLKCLSLLLLFVYAATGARIAVLGREYSFSLAVLIAAEALVAVTAVLLFFGMEPLGNRNSLGAVMGGIAAPILLWGAQLDDRRTARIRSGLMYLLAISITVFSQSRAALATAIFTFALLCFVLHRYKLFLAGTLAVVALFSAATLLSPETVSSATSSILYKKDSQIDDLFASRRTPWQNAVDKIRDHFWIGMGLGTTGDGQDSESTRPNFSSTATVTSENGSSYLAILAGVGVLGAVPFFILIVLLLREVFRVFKWARQGAIASHPSIPLALLIVSGLIHASFEDWMIAPGNYMCVLFWSAAFIFVDMAASRNLRTLSGWVGPLHHSVTNARAH